MKHYRAFQIDPDGHIFGCINLVCDGDDEAKRQAAGLVLLHRIELLRLDRWIGLFDAASGIADYRAMRPRQYLNG